MDGDTYENKRNASRQTEKKQTRSLGSLNKNNDNMIQIVLIDIYTFSVRRGDLLFMH